ncbi:MAG TPA: isoprenylcysteine carboxylmethyltransferase family protein [Caldilineaceae bacterium]|nr:isoprenylcysteine carboxylmethyltransferase family protein [Caldilineaceae bacterium]
MEFFYHWSILILWVCFGGYWAYSGLQSRQTQRAEARTSRLTHLGLVVLAIVLIGFGGFGIGLLTRRILPQSGTVQIIGIAIAALGLLFAVWARVHLGPNWSGTITIKTDHDLIRTGPYALVRHPIYTGLLVGIVGTAIVSGELRGVLAVILIFIAYFRKIHIEETWLVGQFGTEYSEYQKEVRALIPFLV